MPKSVWWFEKLMWLTLVMGAVVGWLDWDRVMSKVQAAAGGAAPVFSIVTMAITLAIMLLLIFLIARVRQNWARWVFLVLFVLGLPFAVLGLPAALAANPVAGTLSLLQIVIQLVALVLVFGPSARPWFNKSVANVPAT